MNLIGVKTRCAYEFDPLQWVVGCAYRIQVWDKDCHSGSSVIVAHDALCLGMSRDTIGNCTGLIFAIIRNGETDTFRVRIDDYVSEKITVIPYTRTNLKHKGGTSNE